jgi:hypothetical protein
MSKPQRRGLAIVTAVTLSLAFQQAAQAKPHCEGAYAAQKIDHTGAPGLARVRTEPAAHGGDPFLPEFSPDYHGFNGG